MLLNYKPKHENIKVIPLIPVSEEAKAAGVSRSYAQLLPGMNEVSEAEWLVMKDHIKRELEAGVIVPVEKEVPASKRAPDGAARTLAQMPSLEAAGIVDRCSNPQTLAKWHGEETREEVRMRVVERMKELKMEAPKLAKAGPDEDWEPPAKKAKEAAAKGAEGKNP